MHDGIGIPHDAARRRGASRFGCRYRRKSNDQPLSFVRIARLLRNSSDSTVSVGRLEYHRACSLSARRRCRCAGILLRFHRFVVLGRRLHDTVSEDTGHRSIGRSLRTAFWSGRHARHDLRRGAVRSRTGGDEKSARTAQHVRRTYFVLWSAGCARRTALLAHAGFLRTFTFWRNSRGAGRHKQRAQD